MIEFMRKYADKFDHAANHRYENFSFLVPIWKLPPGWAFINLPLYSKNLKENWIKFLVDSKENLHKAVEIAR